MNRTLLRAYFSAAVGLTLLVGSGTAVAVAAEVAPGTPAAAQAAAAPQIVLSTPSGYQGQPVTVSGSGFAPSVNVSIYTTDPVQSLRTRLNVMSDAAGSFVAQVVIDAATVPQPAVTFHAGDTTGLNATATFTVLPPVFSASATSGGRGSTFTASGAGYIPGETVWVLFYTSREAIVIPADGSFSTTVTVPIDTPAGQQYLQAFNGRGAGINLPFTVVAPAPSISLDSSSGPAGSVIKLTYGGYIPQENVQLLFGPNQDVIEQFTATTDALSTLTVTVPSGATVGPYSFTLVGSRTTTPLSAPYNVVPVGSSAPETPPTAPQATTPANGAPVLPPAAAVPDTSTAERQAPAAAPAAASEPSNNRGLNIQTAAETPSTPSPGSWLASASAFALLMLSVAMIRRRLLRV